MNLIYGKIDVEVSKSLSRRFSVSVLPQYIYNDYNVRIGDVPYGGLKGTGLGLGAQLAWWLDGEAQRGNFLKAHFEYNLVKVQSNVDQIDVPAAIVGGIFGFQSGIGAFTYSGGIGIGYDLASRNHKIQAHDELGNPISYTIGESGPLQNGWQLIGQLAFGVSF